MTLISFIDLAGLLIDADFNPGTDTAEGIAIVCAESGRRTDARHENLAADGVTVLSVDRGLWQINSKFHPEVTDAMAYDAVLSTREAARISSKGSNFVPWSTWMNNEYRKHMEAAVVALAGHAFKAKLDVATAKLAAVGAQLQTVQVQLAEAEAADAASEAEVATLKARIDQALKDLSA